LEVVVVGVVVVDVVVVDVVVVDVVVVDVVVVVVVVVGVVVVVVVVVVIVDVDVDDDVVVLVDVSGVVSEEEAMDEGDDSALVETEVVEELGFSASVVDATSSEDDATSSTRPAVLTFSVVIVISLTASLGCCFDEATG
jgi:hypothetical protein